MGGVQTKCRVTNVTNGSVPDVTNWGFVKIGGQELASVCVGKCVCLCFCERKSHHLVELVPLHARPLGVLGSLALRGGEVVGQTHDQLGEQILQKRGVSKKGDLFKSSDCRSMRKCV